MSIENGQRFLRLLQGSPALREQVKQGGPSGFEALTATAGASSTSWEVVVAAIRAIEGDTGARKS
jgi:Nif11 domain